jgi:hypothetical protein
VANNLSIAGHAPPCLRCRTVVVGRRFDAARQPPSPHARLPTPSCRTQASSSSYWPRRQSLKIGGCPMSAMSTVRGFPARRRAKFFRAASHPAARPGPAVAKVAPRGRSTTLRAIQKKLAKLAAIWRQTPRKALWHRYVTGCSSIANARYFSALLNESRRSSLVGATIGQRRAELE